MKFKETTKVLENFVQDVVRAAKANLRKKKASGKLQRSIKGQAKVNPKSFELNFEMEPYGAYVDAGVDGKKKKGKFAGRSISSVGFKQSITFLIARKIYFRGLEPTYFFTNAFEAAYKRLPKEFIDKYELDIDNFLKFTTK